MALDNNPNDLDSAAEREAYFEGITTDPDLQKYSPNDIHLSVVNSGNEGTYDQAGEYIAGASGRASQHNNVLAGNVDDNQEALDKSVADEMKSADLSAKERIVSGVEHDVLHEKNPGLDHPVEDLDLPVASVDNENPVVAAIYMALASVGISENQLNEAMGTDNSYRDTLADFHGMAEESGFTELSEYIQKADEVAMYAQLEAGIDNVAPAIGFENTEPELAVQAPEMQLDPEQNVNMSGPTAPAI